MKVEPMPFENSAAFRSSAGFKSNPSCSTNATWNYKTIFKRVGDLFVGLCRSIILSKLKELQSGSLTISEIGREVYNFGDEKSGSSCKIDVLDQTFWPRLLFLGPTGFAEAFIDGSINCSNVTEILELLIINRDDMSDYSSFSAWAVSLISGLYRAANTLSVSLSNVSKHYDLSNQIFAAFLSPDMTYSCPIWSPEDKEINGSTLLEQAQLRKIRNIVSEAKIMSTDHVLEIGTGWGSFAIEVVRQTGCRVTSVTLSIEQKEEAETRILAAGLGKEIHVLLQDYRQIPTVDGGYDKVVSIEMVEHVGREHHEEYFACISRLLNQRHGILVFQTSTMPETRYDSYCRGTDFIRKHIFPGANVPSVTQMITSMHRGSNGKLIPDKIENIGGHYAKALKLWRENFLKNFDSDIRPELLKANPAISKAEIEKFSRKWQWYFCYCEAGFLTKTLGAVMFTATREGNTEMIQNVLELSGYPKN